MTGGNGQDTFYFYSENFGLDVVTDFVSNVAAPGAADQVKVQVTGSTGEWIGTDDFDGTGPQVKFEEAYQLILIDGDGDGFAEANFRLDGISQADQLTATDFLFA